MYTAELLVLRYEEVLRRSKQSGFNILIFIFVLPKLAAC